MKPTVKILSALAVGMAAGAIVGLLFAPDKGSETRRKISERGKKISDEISEKLKNCKEEINHHKEDILT